MHPKKGTRKKSHSFLYYTILILPNIFSCQSCTRYCTYGIRFNKNTMLYFIYGVFSPFLNGLANPLDLLSSWHRSTHLSSCLGYSLTHPTEHVHAACVRTYEYVRIYSYIYAHAHRHLQQACRHPSYVRVRTSAALTLFLMQYVEYINLTLDHVCTHIQLQLNPFYQ